MIDKKQKRLTPYQRIMQAAKKGRGVYLTADECVALSMDNAIETRAGWDDDPEAEESSRKAFEKSLMS